MTDEMTVGQVWVLNFIDEYQRARRSMPSVAVIADATGLGEGTVRLALGRLAELGYLPEEQEWAA